MISQGPYGLKLRFYNGEIYFSMFLEFLYTLSVNFQESCFYFSVVRILSQSSDFERSV